MMEETAKNAATGLSLGLIRTCVEHGLAKDGFASMVSAPEVVARIDSMDGDQLVAFATSLSSSLRDLKATFRILEDAIAKI